MMQTAPCMAHWGVTYAIGPNYNKPWEIFEEDEKPEVLARASQAIAAAMQGDGLSDPLKRALIKALATWYPDDPGVEDFAP